MLQLMEDHAMRALERCLELPTHCKLEMPIKKASYPHMTNRPSIQLLLCSEPLSFTPCILEILEQRAPYRKQDVQPSKCSGHVLLRSCSEAA